jgi:DNA-binding NarL/FixJ family response regulator
MTPNIEILLVEDHELTRQGLAYGLKKSPNISIVAEAENGQEAVALAEKHHPQIILMDIVLPVLNGIKATKLIKERFPDIKILMLTSHADQEKVFEAFAAGADGYCMKDVKTERLVQVIEMVLEGVVWLDPGIASFILKVMPLISDALTKANEKEKTLKDVDLTSREKEILSLIAEGLNNKDIAENLSISLFTVKNHVSNIIQKLSVDDRTQAAILALKKGLI